jgi:hypothetical protein
MYGVGSIEKKSPAPAPIFAALQHFGGAELPDLAGVPVARAGDGSKRVTVETHRVAT